MTRLTGILPEDHCSFTIYRSVLLGMWNVPDKVVDKTEEKLLYSVLDSNVVPFIENVEEYAASESSKKKMCTFTF